MPPPDPITSSCGPAPIIYVNSLPGIGKLTIARAIITLLQTQSPPQKATLIDNHTLIDPVAAKYPRTHPQYLEERKAERDRVFREYVSGPAYLSRFIIFTDCRADNPSDVAVAQEFRATALQARHGFIPVVLTCAVDEHMKRVESEERTQSASTKLVDVATVKDSRREWEERMYLFGVFEELVLDVTCLSGEEATRVIVEWIEKAKHFSEAGAPHFQVNHRHHSKRGAQ